MNIRDSLQLILASTSPRFSERFYENLLSHHPELEARFAGVDLKRQGVLLAMALQVIVEHQLRPHLAMKNYLKLLGNRHHLLGIPPSDYKKFEISLLTTLGDFHDKQWSPQIANEWRTAFEQATELMCEGHADDFETP